MTIPTSGSVTKSNLISQTYANVYNLINDRTKIPDPLGNIERSFVHSRLPNIKASGFKGFPFIVVKKPAPKFSVFTLDNKHAQVDGTISVYVYSSDDMKGFHKDKGLDYFDQIVDDLLETINSETNKKTLRSYTQNNLNIETNDIDDDNLDGLTVFIGSFTISFSTRMAVSS